MKYIVILSGRVVFKDDSIREQILTGRLAPVRYVIDDGTPTESYPMNPNGSEAGIAALCSPDGRHLAMMPHPERCFLPWQWPWMPYTWKASMTVSPWLQMFSNAYQWCKSLSQWQPSHLFCYHIHWYLFSSCLPTTIITAHVCILDLIVEWR